MQRFTTYTYRIYPNKIQQSKININFKACRQVYNILRAERLHILKKFQSYSLEARGNGETVNRYNFNAQNKEESLPQIKERIEWLKKADSLALCAEWNNLNRAFRNYYTHKCKLPKYKGRNDKNSYTTHNVNDNIRIENSKIRLPKIGFVKVKLHRNLPIDYVIKHVIVKENKTGKYYVSIVVKYEDTCINTVSINKIVGLDFKIGDMYVASNNIVSDYQMYAHRYKDKLDNFNKMLDKKVIGSASWKKAINKIRVLNDKIKARRRNNIHNLIKKLVKMNDVIVIEDLSIKNIAKKLGSGTNVYDTSFYYFRKLLEERLAISGKCFLKVDKWFPSSKMCSNCGNIKENLLLDDRVYVCQNCGCVIDRDKNAAINICKEGIRILQEKSGE